VTGCQSAINVNVYEFGNDSDRSIGHGEISAAGMPTAEVFKMVFRRIGHVICGTDDAGFGLSGFGNDTVPNTAAEFGRSFAQNNRGAGSVDDVAEASLTVAIKNSISTEWIFLDFFRTERADIVCLCDQKQQIV